MDPGHPAADAAVASGVDELASAGASILVVGRPQSAARTAFSRRLVADGDGVVLAVAGPRSVCLDLLDEAADGTLVRPASESTHPAVGHSRVTERVFDGGAGALAAATVAAVEDSGSASPRVCLDPVTGLFASDDPDDVFRALHLVTSRVRAADGVVHCHLSLAREDESVSLLETLFDAVVELRTAESGTEQRWSLQNRDVSSGWLPL